MNYKNMVLVALLLPAFCYSQNNEERVSDLEERVSTVEAKTSKQALKIVSLEKKDTVTPRKKIILTHSQKYFFKLVTSTIGWYGSEYGHNYFGNDFNTTFIECFCIFTIADNLLFKNWKLLKQ